MSDTPVITRRKPVAIAHRAGNDLGALRAAEEAGIDLLECDLWPYRGRIEVRHAKTFGRAPIPLLWDREGWRRWWLVPGWRPRLRVAELFAAQGEGSELMLDLKGNDLGLPAAILGAREATGRTGPLTVCSQNWDLLRPFLGRPGVAVVHSVGNIRQLRRLEAEADVTAVSIDRRLLTPAVAARLHARGCFVMTWSVSTWAEAEALLARGADGIISSELDVLRRVMAVRAAREAPPSPAGG
ncbi:MAG: glycerophosphodiester phosphodiesterase [Dehalococcoidia bacterium]|nr:glycerophosphodiester phosphodiesterase [Dehalococcoidia bacterium]